MFSVNIWEMNHSAATEYKKKRALITGRGGKEAVFLAKDEMAFCNMKVQLKRYARSMEIYCIRMKFTLCVKNRHKIYQVMSHG